jgi:NADPH:quinone reductase
VWLRNHLANPVVRAVAHSPAHRLLGRRLVLLAYRGRRTGRRQELPVMAASSGTDLVVLVGQHTAKTWWRNFGASPQEVRVVRRGRCERRGARRLDPGEPGYAEAVQAYVREFPRVRVGRDAPVVVLSDRGRQPG